MKKNRWIQLLVLVFSLLALNAYVVSLIYDSGRMLGYLITVCLFLPLTIWISLANPLGKLPAVQRKSGYLKLFDVAVTICFMLSAVVIRDIEQVLGGFALVPLNLFSALLCLLKPIDRCKNYKK